MIVAVAPALSGFGKALASAETCSTTTEVVWVTPLVVTTVTIVVVAAKVLATVVVERPVPEAEAAVPTTACLLELSP